MSDDTFAAVDHYLDGLFGPPDPVLAATLEHSQAEGLPAIAVSPNLGRLLHVLALASGARTVLEIGTLGGYSTICLARPLPADGTVVSLEYEPHHAAVARHNVERAGLSERVDIRVGRALDLLADLERDQAGPFDLVFIDADKPPYAEYYEAAVRLSGPGTLIVADNVVRRGAVTDSTSGDPNVIGAQRLNAALASDPRVAGAVVQTVGVKGHDGMALAVVRHQ